MTRTRSNREKTAPPVGLSWPAHPAKPQPECGVCTHSEAIQEAPGPVPKVEWVLLILPTQTLQEPPGVDLGIEFRWIAPRTVALCSTLTHSV